MAIFSFEFIYVIAMKSSSRSLLNSSDNYCSLVNNHIMVIDRKIKRYRLFLEKFSAN